MEAFIQARFHDASAACSRWMPSRFGRLVDDGRMAFAIGDLLMIANVPWTLLGVMPTNKILMQTELAAAGPQSRALIVKWNGLHAVRSGLGVLAILAFLIALSD
jgi:hypothetical protein